MGYLDTDGLRVIWNKILSFVKDGTFDSKVNIKRTTSSKNLPILVQPTSGNEDYNGEISKTTVSINGETNSIIIGNGKNSGDNSLTIGFGNTNQGNYSETQGTNNQALAINSHSEGLNNIAGGMHSHAEGVDTEVTPKGIGAHTEGIHTIANAEAQHVSGKYNIKDSEEKYLEIVGNGTSSNRSNARTLDINGNEYISGKITVGKQPTAPNDVATKQYVDNHSGGGGGEISPTNMINIGLNNESEDEYSTLIGTNNSSTGTNTIIIGSNNKDLFNTLVADNGTIVGSGNTVAENATDTTVIGRNNFINGAGNSLIGGNNNKAYGSSSVILGDGNNSTGNNNSPVYIVGGSNVANGNYSLAIGQNNKSYERSLVGGLSNNFAVSSDTYVIGEQNSSSSNLHYGVVIGTYNKLNGKNTGYTPSIAIGHSNTTLFDNMNSSANIAIGEDNSVVDGGLAIGSNNVAKKSGTSIGMDNHSVAIGQGSFVCGNRSTVNGLGNTSIGGSYNNVYGEYGFSTGSLNKVDGKYNFASGYNSYTGADASFSSVEGNANTSNGKYSHTEGMHNINNGDYAHIFGKYNLPDENGSSAKYVEIVGNGKTSANRNNARTLDWDGNEILSGTITAKEYRLPDGTIIGGGDKSSDNIDIGINSISNDSTGNFVSGNSNTLSDTSLWNVVIGYGNNASSSNGNFIGGNRNKISNTSYSLSLSNDSTVNGNSNINIGGASLLSGFSNIWGGTNNTCDGSYNILSGTGYTNKGSYNLGVSSGSKVEGTFNICSLNGGNNIYGSGNIVSGSGNTIGSKGDNSNSSFVVGSGNTISTYDFVFGSGNTISKSLSNSIGNGNKISEARATSTGNENILSGSNVIVIGNESTASGDFSFTIGNGLIAKNKQQLILGSYNIADISNNGSTENGEYIEIFGNGGYVTTEGGTRELKRSNARTLDWEGNEKLLGKLTVGVNPSEDMDVATKEYVDNQSLYTMRITPETLGETFNNGTFLYETKDDGTKTYRESNNTASGYLCHAEGWDTTASGDYCHAEGSDTNAGEYGDHAEGDGCRAIGGDSHAEGDWTLAKEYASHSEGNQTTAMGQASHAEGAWSKAVGDSSHAEGEECITQGYSSHAEGYNTKATRDSAHAEGEYTLASGYASHAGGEHCTASGSDSFAGGLYTEVSGKWGSFAYGNHLIANSRSQFVFGECNIADENASTDGSAKGKYIEIVGNGNVYIDDKGVISDDVVRSNARTLDWNGNEELSGIVKAKGFYVGETELLSKINELEERIKALENK